jgi:predicted Zn finger-like uncharacterized protein
MSILVQCPECSAEHDLTDHLAGKKVRCKKCEAVVAVPPSTATAEDAPRRPRSRPEAATGVQEKRAPQPDRDDEERPRRRSWGEENDRPVRPQRTSSPPSNMWIVWLLAMVGGGVLLIGAAASGSAGSCRGSALLLGRGRW